MRDHDVGLAKEKKTLLDENSLRIEIGFRHQVVEATLDAGVRTASRGTLSSLVEDFRTANAFYHHPGSPPCTRPL